MALHADQLGDSKIIKVSYDASFCDQLLDETMERSMETIRRRVDAFGTKEPTLQKQGNRALLIQVPGIKDLSSLKSIIGKTAQLSFHLMIDAQDQSKGIASKSILFGSQLCQIGFLPLITGDLLTDACVQFIEGRPVVAFSFNSIGARIFGDVTRSYKGRQLAIV